MVKKLIKDTLHRRQLKVYRKRIADKHVFYNDWILFELSKPFCKAKAAFGIKTFCFDEIMECDFSAIKDDSVVIFRPRTGKMALSSQDRIKAFMDLNPEINLVYGDEDEVLDDGTFDKPFFKPSWSPDTYLDSYYVGSIFAVRGKSLKRVTESEGWKRYATADENDVGKADFSCTDLCFSPSCAADMLFFLLAQNENGFDVRKGLSFEIGHIDEVLFHREGTDPYYGRKPGSGKINEASADGVSIVIPSKDHPDILFQCIESLAGHDNGAGYEIIIVDNGSSSDNKSIIEKKIKEPGLPKTKYLYENMEFNFSKMCNMGAAAAENSYLLFLNDDIEIVSDGLLGQLLSLASRKWAGAVGAKLLYPDSDLIQHAGITKVRLGPMHKLSKMTDSKEYYFGFNRGIHDLIGVTGACIMISADKFREAGGFPEELAVAFNDVDLCYSLIEKGYYNVCNNNIFLYHHESLSRGNDNLSDDKLERLGREYDTLMKRHDNLRIVDPFYHKYLSDDEHVADFLRSEYNNFALDDVERAEITTMKNAPSDSLINECVRIGVEYANTCKRWAGNYKLSGDTPSGYLIKGYSFVIGSDNADYERKLLLRRVEGEPKAPVVLDSDVMETPVDDEYREDIKKNLKGQINVDLTGFRTIISDDMLQKGKYQIGVLFTDKTSRLKIMNWAPNILKVGEEED